MAITSYYNNYYDDINTEDANQLTPQDKNYLRILFKPGRAVQSRELNQIQSLLQLQIDRFGQSLFSNNSPIYGAECIFDRDVKVIDVEIEVDASIETTLKTWIEYENTWVTNDDFKNQITLTQNNTSLLAVILKSELLISDNPNILKYRLYIKYKSKTINDAGENISSFGVGIENNPTTININYLPIGAQYKANIVTFEDNQQNIYYQGQAVSAFINSGIVYTKGSAALVNKQYITVPFVDENNQLVANEKLYTGNAILKVNENIISASVDISLNDNASGSPNFAAPGADRYQVNLELLLVDDFVEGQSNEEYKDAINILTIKDSNVILKYNGTDNLKVIERILALRTYEESGDYVLAPFKATTFPIWNDPSLNNNGKFVDEIDLVDAFKPYLVKEGVDISTYGNDENDPYKEYIDASEDWFSIQLDPSTAYVKGYRIALPEANILLNTKTRKTFAQYIAELDNNIILDEFSPSLHQYYNKINLSANLGNYVTVEYDEGLPNIDNPNITYLLWGSVGSTSDGETIAATAATLNVDPSGDNNNFILTAKESGNNGNNISIILTSNNNPGYAIAEVDPIGTNNSFQVTAQPAGVDGNLLTITITPETKYASLFVNPIGDSNIDNSLTIISIEPGSIGSQYQFASVRDLNSTEITYNVDSETGNVYTFTHNETVTIEQIIDFINITNDIPFRAITESNDPSNILFNSTSNNISATALIYEAITFESDEHYRDINFKVDDSSGNEVTAQELIDYINITETVPFIAEPIDSITSGVITTSVTGPISLAGGSNYVQISYEKIGDRYQFFFDPYFSGTTADDLIAFINQKSELPFTAKQNGDSFGKINPLSQTFLIGGRDSTVTISQNEYPWYDADGNINPEPEIGTCKIQTIESVGENKLRLYLHDINLYDGYGFNEVHFIGIVNNITGSDPEDQHYGAFKATLTSPGEINNIENSSSLFKLPYTSIRSVRDLVITEKRSKTQLYDFNADLVSFTTSHFFDSSPNNIEVLFYIDSLNQYVIVTDYDINIHPNGKQIDLSFNNSRTSGQLQSFNNDIIAGNNNNVRILISVEVALNGQSQSLEEKRGTKVLKTRDIVIRHNEKQFVPNINETIQLDNIKFNSNWNVGVEELSDIYHLVSINQIGDSPIGFEIVNDGQTPTEYVPATLKAIRNFNYNTDGNELDDEETITINITYWDFTDGDYYTANSYYIDDDLIPMGTYPTYNNIRLCDYLDFRQRSNSTNRVALDPYSQISCAIDYYLPRKDTLVVKTNSEFSIIRGEPAINPSYPKIPDNAMALYNIDILPYVYNISSDIKLTRINNQRYTMRDIGGLDKRISSLEYYSILSLLEKSAQSESIYDASGERFKNGFVVDNFKGHNVGDPSNINYKCSIDRKKGILYPHHEGYSVPFRLSNINEILPNVNYPKTGVNTNNITLRYKSVTYINQPFATRYISVQPHEVVSVPGFLKLYPEEDTWVDTVTRPSVTIDPFEEVNDAIRQLAEETGVLGTEWGEWAVTDVTSEVNTSTVGNVVRTTEEVRDRSTRTRTITVTETGSLQTTTATNTSVSSLRSGVETSYVEANKIDQNLGNYISGIELKPWMRSRPVLIKASGLAPNSRYYPIFDKVNVSNYCWNLNSNQYLIVEQQINDGTFDGLNELALISLFNELFENKNLSSNLIGDVYGVFVVPNSNNLRFASGEKTLKLTDSPRNNLNEEESFAEAKYVTNGLKTYSNDIIFTTRPLSLEKRDVEETKTETTFDVNVGETIVFDNVVSSITRRYDPIAQSFIINEPTGIFVSDIDLYFANKPESTFAAGVNVYLVATKNGYPSQDIIPGSRVFKSSDEIFISNDSSLATNFEFEDPLYLAADEEYAVVVFSENPSYKVYISELGGVSADLLTGQIVKSQPALGVFFTSSNKRTWIAEPNQDLKFILNRASFDIHNKATVLAKPIIGSGISHITISNAGNYYDYTSTINIAAPVAESLPTSIFNLSPTVDSFKAEAVPLLIDANNGEIKKIKLTNTGYGYISPPAVTITGGDGTATAVAHLSRTDISDFVLNQESLLFDKTSIKNVLSLGPENNKQIYNIKAGSPFMNLKPVEHYINNNVKNATELQIKLSTDDERLSPVIDTTTLALQTRKYNVTTEKETTSKYYTKKITLENPADQIDGYLTINRPSNNANVETYIKLYDINDKQIINKNIPQTELLKVTSSPTFIYDNLEEGNSIEFLVTIKNVSSEIINGITLSFDRTVNVINDDAGLIDSGNAITLDSNEEVTVLYSYIVTATDVDEGNILNNTWTIVNATLNNSIVDNSDPNSLITIIRKNVIIEDNLWWKIDAIEPRNIPISNDKGEYNRVRYQRNFESNNIEFSSFVIKVVLYSANIVEVPTISSLTFIAST